MNDAMQLLQTLTNLPVIALIMARIGGLVIFAPFFSSSSIPAKTRIFLAAGITLTVLPFAGKDIPMPADLGSLVVGMIGELMIGMVIGLIVSSIFTGLQLAGTIIDQQMGISMAQVLDPLFDEETSILSQFYFWLALIIFLSIKGHILLIGAMVKSFQTIPPGQFVVNDEVVMSLTKILQVSFVIAMQITAPLVVATLLTTLAMGFVARTVPQLNILSVGFAIRLVLGYVLVLVCLIPVMEVFRQAIDTVFLNLYQLLGF
jgi:flagellar biosynthetic protein FliR